MASPSDTLESTWPPLAIHPCLGRNSMESPWASPLPRDMQKMRLRKYANEIKFPICVALTSPRHGNKEVDNEKDFVALWVKKSQYWDENVGLHYLPEKANNCFFKPGPYGMGYLRE
jgi:hypothetical protein